MSEFNTNDIDDAKRRVEDMRRRAKGFVDAPADDEKPPEPPKKSSLFSLFSSDKTNSDTSLILALVLILSREGADNMLILALLYILL